jgi:hypothetical protein
MVAQPTIHFSVVGGGGELCAGLGMREEGCSRANIFFLQETCHADAKEQNTIKWCGWSIFPAPSGTHIVRSHAQKACGEGG